MMKKLSFALFFGFCTFGYNVKIDEEVDEYDCKGTMQV